MVHVRVREQHEINLRQLTEGQCRRDEPFRPDGSEADIRADVIHQHRIGQNISRHKN